VKATVKTSPVAGGSVTSHTTKGLDKPRTQTHTPLHKLFVYAPFYPVDYHERSLNYDLLSFVLQQPQSAYLRSILPAMLPSNYITATEAIALVIKEQLTIDQVLKDHKDRYEQRNNQVKAWVCIDHTGNKALKGPLQGMIIGVKDIISTLHPSRIS
jgi:hypothetical protein